MQIPELKDELRRRRLRLAGRKRELVEQLLAALRVEREHGAQEDDPEDDNDDDLEEDDDDDEIGVVGVRLDVNGPGNRNLNSQDDGVRVTPVTRRSRQDEPRCTVLTFRDVEDSLEKFSGDDLPSVSRWIEDFEEMSDTHMVVFAKKLLTGSAKSFVRYERGMKFWAKLKDEFEDAVSDQQIHQELANRTKRPDESLQQYMNSMREIAGQGRVDIQSQIGYIIQGIPDEVANKAVLYGAKNMQQLKERIFPISHIVALVGDPTYLPCDISTTHEGDSVHLVLWYREDLGTSVYSVDARDRDFGIAERWSDDTVFSNRAYFMPDKKPAELGVDHIREEDAGIYRCRVDFQIGQTRNSKVNLTVIVPPHKIVIVDDSGIARNSMVGPYIEGDTLRLYCDVYGGKPAPTVSWHRDDKLVSNKTVTVRNGVTRNELVIKNLGRDDVRSMLTCNATNNNRSIPLSSTVYVDMNFPPLEVKIIGSNQPLSAGKRYELVCTTSGSRPPATVTWWRNDQRLVETKETTSSDGNTTTSILSFMATKADAGRQLSCRAEHPIMGAESIKDDWVLEIQYTPETRIQLGTSLNPNAIREGTDVYFDCLIHAEPPVYKVEWRHLEKTLHLNITQGIIISNQSLVLQGVDRKSAGNYTCVGYNTEGDGESSPFYLNVMFAPTCKPNQTKVHGVAKQEKANISCQVDANPPEVQFRWTFNNSAESIDVAASHIARAGTSSIVSYTPMTELDYGTLLCWATNRIGHQQVPCVYHIIPAGRPDMVHNCTTSNTSTNSFSVRCAEGFNGGLPQSFLLEVRESNSQELRANLTSMVPRFSVTQLESGALYQACIYAYNDKGRSEAMVVQAGTLRLPEKQLTSESERPRQNMRLMPMLSVMIGVVTALIIVAVIVMVVLRIQHTQVDEQSKSQMEDHSKQTKTIPIQRELRFREGSSLLTDEKHPSSPFRKLESSGDISENDEKNPDIIPQQITGDEPSEYLRKRRLVSTIETSPSRSLLEHSTVTSVSGHGSYVGYCTIRNGMPLHEFSNLTKHKSFQPIVGDDYQSGVCTLPRQHWPSQSVQSMSMTMSPPILYTGVGVVSRTCPSGTLMTKDMEARIPAQCCIQSQKDGKISTPIVMAKRESSV